MSRSPRAESALYFARPSVAAASPSASTSPSSKVAASAMACGKLVAVPPRATPWSASFHQLYAGIPSRSMAGAS